MTLINFILAFIVGAGSALGVVIIGGEPTKWQIVGAIVAGLVIAAKDTRSFLKLPPIDPTKAAVFIIFGLLSGLLVLGLVGCRTASNPSGVVSVGGHQIDPVKTGKAIQIAAKYGAIETIRQKPETRIYFEEAAAGIAIAINSGNYNPTNIVGSLTLATGNQDVASGIADALTLYQDFFGDLVSAKLDGYSPYTVPVLSGLAAGIQQAVDLTKP